MSVTAERNGSGNGTRPAPPGSVLDHLDSLVGDAKVELVTIEQRLDQLKEAEANELKALKAEHAQRRRQVIQSRDRLKAFLRGQGAISPPAPKAQARVAVPYQNRPKVISGQRLIEMANAILKLTETQEHFTAGEIIDEMGFPSREKGTHVYPYISGLREWEILGKAGKAEKPGRPDLWRVWDRDRLERIAAGVNVDAA